MRKLKALENLKTKLVSLLNNIGDLLNSIPTAEENAGVKQSPLMRAHMWEKSEKKSIPQKKRTKIKNSSHRKGRRDTATEIFNHPRKDYHT